MVLFFIYLWQEVAGFPFRVTLLLSVTDVSGSVLLDSLFLIKLHVLLFPLYTIITCMHVQTTFLGKIIHVHDIHVQHFCHHCFFSFFFSFFYFNLLFLILAEYTVGHKQK